MLLQKVKIKIQNDVRGHPSASHLFCECLVVFLVYKKECFSALKCERKAKAKAKITAPHPLHADDLSKLVLQNDSIVQNALKCPKVVKSYSLFDSFQLVFRLVFRSIIQNALKCPKIIKNYYGAPPPPELERVAADDLSNKLVF